MECDLYFNEDQINQNCLNSLKISHTEIHQALSALKNQDVNQCKDKVVLVMDRLTKILRYL